jgi:competence protein ComEC
MSTLSLMALLFGRGNSIHISLFLTAAIFIFFEPLIIFDVGFLLSMAATLGLVYILPVLVDVRKKFFKKLKFFDDYVFPTFSCTVSTLPISLITFGTFSVWSVPVNVVILPVIETTMLWGVLSLLLINIHKPLSYFLMLLADLQLKYFEYIVNSVGRLNIGSWEVLGIEGSVLAIVILSLLLLLTIYFYPIENEKYNWYIKNS